MNIWQYHQESSWGSWMELTIWSNLILALVGDCFPYFRWYSWRTSSYILSSAFQETKAIPSSKTNISLNICEKINWILFLWKWIFIFETPCIWMQQTLGRVSEAEWLAILRKIIVHAKISNPILESFHFYILPPQ